MKPDRVYRTEDGKVLSVVFTFGNIQCTFHMNECKLKCSKVSSARIYDRGGMDIPYEPYIHMLKIAYAIFKEKPKPSKAKQLDLALDFGGEPKVGLQKSDDFSCESLHCSDN